MVPLCIMWPFIVHININMGLEAYPDYIMFLNCTGIHIFYAQPCPNSLVQSVFKLFT